MIQSQVLYKKTITLTLDILLKQFIQEDIFLNHDKTLSLDLFSTNTEICAICFKNEELLFLKKHQKKFLKLVNLNQDPNIEKPLIMFKLESFINDFFHGKKPDKSDLPILWLGTDFQKSVLEKLLLTNYGEQITYKKLAESIGLKNGFQAIGQAVRNNPISILIPCHRVVSSYEKAPKSSFFFGQVSQMKSLLRNLEIQTLV